MTERRPSTVASPLLDGTDHPLSRLRLEYPTTVISLRLLAARENFPLLACENVPLGEAGFLACARRGS